MQMLKKERSSNIELFRIITMIIIVAHHYVVNSNLINIIEANYILMHKIYLYFCLVGVERPELIVLY